MVDLAATHPEYGWEINKGYASPEHLEALRRLGPCVQHRRSWAIPGGRGEVALDDASLGGDGAGSSGAVVLDVSDTALLDGLDGDLVAG